MSKYIRTKDGVYELISDLNNKGYNVKVENHGTYRLVPKSTITAEADTIEELYDELVIVNTTDNRDNQVISKYDFRRIFEYSGDNDYEIYGSIWVYGNLIKVARMNEKGCLELL